ncbi:MULTISPECIES: carboxyltransferase domain-containing protein [unclassified Acidovorax]|uniref:carboxyltransferase domain-containing protein n=1 Tax=unclassified Acidovorax TaxID=2684926 RepID=UPI001C48F26B|nr:allophanate hydrolase subunit 1 [Acidovorax sp. sif0732]MBV7451165.1 allophanate hydrolase subunit 1 [Acidovorax sp. sif0715]
MRPSDVVPQVQATIAGRVREVDIFYEGPLALDLTGVALSKGLSVEQVVNYHHSGDNQIRMYGFAPGYAYMSGIPTAIQVPRKSVVLRDIAVGSVTTTGPQCLIPTLKMPTG